MSKTCEYCNCPLVILRSPREKRTICVSCKPEQELPSTPIARVLRIDEFLKNRTKKGKNKCHA